MAGRLFVDSLAASVALFALACSASTKGSEATAGDDGSTKADGPMGATGDDGTPQGDDASTEPDDASMMLRAVDSGKGSTGKADAGSAAAAFDGSLGSYPAGWLYTDGAKIYESNGGGSGTPWMGRGVNIDDIFFCGYNDSLWMSSPDSTLEQVVGTLMSGWHPSFVRVSLAMDSYGTAVSWLSDPAQYKTPMTNVVDAFGSYSGVHVLVTLRSDASMIGQDTSSGDSEATGIPSSASNTPSASEFPTGTDAVYVALVDAFANDGFVLFGLTNEPGGNTASNATLGAAMNHAVGVIRAEENRLGVPHHVVSVQGNSWTSNIAFYAETSGGAYPDGGTGIITYDNVVYEVHGYPPAASEYTFPNIPVIIGEYGSLPANDAGTDPTFFDDVETKQIPNLAWDFDPYSNCAPDLVNVNDSPTNIAATAWGTMVKSYLLAHAN
jgi:hypothetical protein